MKLSWGVAASTLSCAAAAATTGHVFTFDASRTPSTVSAASSPVDPETARLILAQRLGLSRFHSIKNADAEAIKNINAFGGRQQKLFGEKADTSRARLVVWIEDGDEATMKSWADHATSSFELLSSPPRADNDRLVEDIITQAESLPKYADPTGSLHVASIDADVALSPLKKATIHNEYLTVFRADKTNDFDRTILRKTLADLALLDMDITAVIMPPSPANAKRRVQSPYGTYDMPALSARRENPEAILSLTAEPSVSPHAAYPDLEDFPVFTSSKKSSNNTTVRRILPPFFDSLESCQKTTLNCSGHGECKLLHKAQTKGNTDRYGCVCSPTVVKLGKDGRKATYWGGPACQKKDISTPFWLFVGVGVGLAFLISTIIGMMYSIGTEELPSVIGAGVSGPVRK